MILPSAAQKCADDLIYPYGSQSDIPSTSNLDDQVYIFTNLSFLRAALHSNTVYSNTVSRLCRVSWPLVPTCYSGAESPLWLCSAAARCLRNFNTLAPAYFEDKKQLFGCVVSPVFGKS